jgi:predicted amidophosphoribosyltransferase
MEYAKYVCPECSYEQEEPDVCPTCKVPLIASCPVCGNPIVGEHIRLKEQDTQRM